MPFYNGPARQNIRGDIRAGGSDGGISASGGQFASRVLELALR
jgi:hypothetical protein